MFYNAKALYTRALSQSRDQAVALKVRAILPQTVFIMLLITLITVSHV